MTRTFIPEAIVNGIAGGKGEVEFIIGEYAGLRGRRLGPAGFMRSEVALADGRKVVAVNSEFFPVADLEAIKARGNRGL